MLLTKTINLNYLKLLKTKLSVFVQNKLFFKDFKTLLIVLILYILKGHAIEYFSSFHINDYGKTTLMLDFSKFERLYITVIIAPLIETYIFQHLIFKFYFKIFRKNLWHIIIAILISSLIFGAAHHYNYFTMFGALLSGFFLGYTYFFNNNRLFTPFWCVFIVHACHNLYVFLHNI